MAKEGVGQKEDGNREGGRQSSRQRYVAEIVPYDRAPPKDSFPKVRVHKINPPLGSFVNIPLPFRPPLPPMFYRSFRGDTH